MIKEGARLNNLTLKLCHTYNSNLTPVLRGSWFNGAITPSTLRSHRRRRRVPAEIETHLTKGK